MKITARGVGRLARLCCLLATAFLLNACQQNATSGSSPTFSNRQKASDDQETWYKPHCCHRGGRNGGGGVK